MDRLAHWEFAVDFTGAQAAALVFGLDLHELQADHRFDSQAGRTSANFAPAYQRMKQCYNATRRYYLESLRPPLDWDEQPPAAMLESVELVRRWRKIDADLDHQFCNWANDEDFSGFETQRFDRAQIAGWLAKIGQRSEYRFTTETQLMESASLASSLGPGLTSARESKTHLNIIGALLELVQSPRAGRDSDAAVIRELVENYPDKQGISKRTLEDKFAQAKRSLVSN
jgi:hypothetical protein